MLAFVRRRQARHLRALRPAPHQAFAERVDGDFTTFARDLGRFFRYARRDRAAYAIAPSEDLTASLTIRDLAIPASSRIRVFHETADLA